MSVPCSLLGNANALACERAGMKISRETAHDSQDKAALHANVEISIFTREYTIESKM